MAAPVVLGSAALSSGLVAVLAGNYGLVTQNGASYAVFDALQVAILGIDAQTTLSASQALTFPTNGSPDRRPNPTGGAAVTALPGGGLAVESWGGADANYYVQILNNAGTVTTAPFVIGTANAGGVSNIDPYNPVGAIDAWSGGIVVAWAANDEQLDKFERLSNAGSVVGSVITFASSQDSTNWFGSMAVDSAGNVIFGIASENVNTPASFLEYNAGNTLVATGTLDELANPPYFAALPGGGFVTVGYVPTGAYSNGYPGFNLTIQTISATGTVTRVETYGSAAAAGYPPVVTELAVSSTGTLVFLEPGHTALDKYVIATGVLTRDALAIPSGVTLTGGLVADSSGDVDSAATTGTHVVAEQLLGAAAAASGPTITAGAAVTFIGGGSTVALDPTLSVSDAASATLAGATIAINSGFVAGDTLGFTNQNGIAGSYNGTTGTLTLSGTASIANYQSALDSISYDFTPTNGDPTAAASDTSRAIGWVVTDGTTSSGAAASVLHVIHAAPTVTAGGTVGFFAGGTAVAVDAAIGVSDPDSGGTLTGGTVTITSGLLTGDTLGFTAQAGITGSYNALTGALTLTGTASVASYRAALASVTYGSSALDPTALGSDDSRTIAWTVTDGVAASGAASTVVDITKTGPVVTAGTIVSFIGGAGAVVLDSGLQVSDGESLTLTGATVAIVTGLTAGDQLNFTAQNGITGSYSAITGVLTLSGAATLAQYQTALESVSYSFLPADADPTGAGLDTSRTIDWIANDGTHASAPAASTVDEVHYAPAITAGGTVTFAAGGPAIPLDGSVTVADPDSSGKLAGATVWVASGFITGDELTVTPQSGIVDSYNAATGVLTLAGTATLAEYQAALASVSYDFTPSTADPTDGGADPTRVVDYAITDGIANSGTASVTLDTEPAGPIIVAGGVAVFIGGGSPVVLDAALVVSDPSGGGTLSGGTVAIGAGFLAGDTLGFTAQSGITGAYNATTGVLTLSGTASVAAYQTALDAVTYSLAPTNGDPTGGGGDTGRVIDWMVTDGSIVSESATSVLDTVHVAPTVTAGGTVTFTGGGPAVLADPTLTLTDLDSGGELTGATVAIGAGFLVGGTLGFTAQSGITGGYNANTGVLTLSGTASIAAYQAVLDSVTYGYLTAAADPTAGGTDPARVIDWTVRDGAASSAVATSAISTVHAPPTLTAGGTVSFAAGGAAVALDPTLTVADPDSGGTLTGATVAISTGFLPGDTLVFATQHNIVGVYNPTTGDASAAGADPSRTITWTVTDGVASSATGTSTLDQVVAGPTVAAGGTVTFTGGGTAVVLDPALTLSDVKGDGELAGATVSIANGFLTGDTLSVIAPSGITDSYNAATGVLTLFGTASIASYQAALDSVSYDFTPATGDPTGGGRDTSRMITWVVNDGTVSSVAATSTLAAVTAGPSPGGPTLSASGTVVFTVAEPAITLDPNVTPADTYSDGVLTGATVAITGGTFTADGDLLGAITRGTPIVASYGPDETLTLAGTASVADYEQVLRTVAFESLSADPTDGGSDPTRTITWTVRDGSAVSNKPTTTVAIGTTGTVTPIGPISTGPTVTAVATDPTSGVEGVGQVITLTLTMSAAVIVVGGTPSLTLNDGGTASYDATDSSGATLVFTYQVAAGQNASALAVTGVSLGGATITGADAETADLSGAVGALPGVLQIETTGGPAAPTTPALSPASDSGFLGDDITDVITPTFAGTGTPGDTITLYDGAASVGSAVAGTLGIWSITATPLGLGTATLSATDTDASGAVSASSGTLDLTIVAAPAAPAGLFLSPSGGTITNDTTPDITGTGIAGDTVILYDGSTQVGSGLVGQAGSWSIITAMLSDGAHALSATQTDAYGDVSAASATLDLTVGTVSTGPAPPANLALAPASDSGVQGDDITNVTTPDITGTGIAGDTITLYDQPAIVIQPLDNAGTQVGSAVVADDGTWSIVTTALGAGAQALSATQTDTTGAVSTDSTALIVTIDTAAAAPTIAVEAAESTSPARPVVGGQAPDDGTVTILQDGSAVGTVVAGTAGAWSFAFPTALADGTYTITATAIDVAGNVSPLSGTLSVQVNDDGSYSAGAPPDSSGDYTTSYFDTDGTVTAVDTYNSAGQLLESVSNTQALLEIYDSHGNLIGTVTQPSSSALSDPGFSTQAQGDTAVTNTGTAGSMLVLEGEQNVVHSQGDDTINAGSGADTILASGAATSVTGGSGSLVLLASDSASTVSGGTGSDTVFAGAGGSIQGGSAGGNLLVATGGTTTLVGGGSGDTEVAAGGFTTLVLRPNGTAFGGAGTSTVFGAGNDTMVGGSGNTVMVGNSSSGNAMFGANGNTTMFGSTGNDTMVGGSGQTVMVLGGGNDLVAGGSGSATVFGGGGSDSYFATGGGTMYIMEGAGPSQVVLGAGATNVTDGSGADVIDVTNGQAGGADLINGFKVGTDQLNLFGYAASNAQPQFSGGNAIFKLSDGTTITLVGVSSLAPNSVA